MNEADTCRHLVRPKLEAAGWDQDLHSYTEQTNFTDGRIVVTGSVVRRRKKKVTDFLLRYTRDVTLAVVEAKSISKPVGTGLQQAKEYAEILGLKFAYATNGREIVEFDYLTGLERPLDTFPTPDQLWQRFLASSPLDQVSSQEYLSPSYHLSGKSPRYYQEIAINRAIMAILSGQHRVLLTMATGTGKTIVAFQICWKLWSARWNRDREHRRPRILFLSDRKFLVDDPKDKTFAPFGDARSKIENGNLVKSREMYFALYQSIAKDQTRPGLYKEYSPNFFDLIVIDECHRGSARDNSNWREILDYFEPAHKLGMTATPLRDDNANTYLYFGPPVYTYSLKQGIQDGFLAPYRVHRIVSTYDAAGWRPDQGQLDRFGREIPDDEYHTKDFEKVVAPRARSEAIAKHLTKHLIKTDRFAKTIVFCVDQEHADVMRRAISNENSDLVAQYPDYVCRVTSDESEIGRGHLSRFQELETQTPVVLTTSQMLTTGVDAPTCKNVVLARVVESMTDFKQIIGRGTRVRDDYGKLYFSILDYTGSATRLFADRNFDGEPVIETEVEVNEEGDEVAGTEEVVEASAQSDENEGSETEEEPNEFTDASAVTDDIPPQPRKFYVDTGAVTIDTELELELDPEGSQLSLVKIDDYAAEKVRSLYTTLADFRAKWADPEQRPEIIALFEDRGISFDQLASAANQPDADPFDLLCHLAFNAPLRTRRERAERLRKDKQDFFDQYGPEAKAILEELLTKYAEHGMAQFVLPDALEVPPVSEHGNVLEIATTFGGAAKLMEAINRLQELLYAA